MARSSEPGGRARPPAGPPPTPPPTGWKLWWAGARPRTLPAAIVPVLVGTACAAGVLPRLSNCTGGLNDCWVTVVGNPGPTSFLVWWRAVAAMVVALAIQVGTNYANDYSDGKRGTDDPGARVGPVRLVGSGLASPGSVKRAALASFAVAGLAGLALAAATTWWLIAVGAVCFAAGWFYTGGPKPYGYAGLGEVFVFVFFGLVATVGSCYVQVLQVTWLAVGAAVPVGLLATALLVVNNLRDIPSDSASGKRTLAVKLGDRRTRFFYLALMVLPYVIVPFVAGLGGRPLAAASLFAILLANKPVLEVLQGAKGPALIPVLGATGRVQLVFGLLFAAGLFLSAPTPIPTP